MNELDKVKDYLASWGTDLHERWLKVVIGSAIEVGEIRLGKKLRIDKHRIAMRLQKSMRYSGRQTEALLLSLRQRYAAHDNYLLECISEKIVFEHEITEILSGKKCQGCFVCSDEPSATQLSEKPPTLDAHAISVGNYNNILDEEMKK